MPSLFESTWGTRVLPAAQRAFGVSVVLTQSGQSTDAFTARRNDWHYQGQGDEIVVDVSMRSYILPVESLLIHGVAVVPRIGDRIVEGDDVFEIMPTDQDEAVQLQSGGYEYIVHCKRRRK